MRQLIVPVALLLFCPGSVIAQTLFDESIPPAIPAPQTIPTDAPALQPFDAPAAPNADDADPFSSPVEENGFAPPPVAPPAVAPPAADSKVEHLRQAEQHLMAAGFPEHAAEIRQLIEQLSAHGQLSDKLAELERLQAEIDQLRQRAGVSDQSRSLMLQVQLVEVRPDKLRRLGMDRNLLARQLGKLTDQRLPTPVQAQSATAWGGVGDTRQIERAITGLRAQEAVVIIAEPTLLTVGERPATFFSGGEIPLPIPAAGGLQLEFIEIGVRIEILPTWIAEDRVRLEVRPELSEINQEASVTISNVNVPGVRRANLQATIEMPLQQTLLLGGMRLGQRDIFALITPSAVEPNE